MRCTAIASEKTAAKPNSARLHLINGSERPDVRAIEIGGHALCGNFCRCWMPTWFDLLEIVGQERRGAGNA